MEFADWLTNMGSSEFFTFGLIYPTLNADMLLTPISQVLVHTRGANGGKHSFTIILPEIEEILLIMLIGILIALIFSVNCPICRIDVIGAQIVC
ncbi:hypothetical protein ACTXT7_015620 [Hymenolepis weldensis]